MNSKNGWAFVALYNGKEVKKYVTTCEEVDNYQWITKTKFCLRDGNDTYYEGIILAKEDNEQGLQEMISKKNPRCPHNAFNPFPDPSMKSMDMVGKWKTRLAKIAINDSPISKKCHEMSSEKKIPNNCVSETTSVKITTHKEGNGPIFSNTPANQNKNHPVSSDETELQQGHESVDVDVGRLNNGNKKPINRANEAETSPEASCEENKLSSLERNDMVSQRKYNKLLKKYRSLRAIFSEERKHFTRDLQIQHLTQCLYKAIQQRYNEEEEKD